MTFQDKTSEVLDVNYGVPQGSILGPLLFLLSVNDIANCYSESDCKFVLYADDTNIFITGPSKEKTFIKAKKILKIVSDYMKSNLLHINMSKCCYIHFKPNCTIMRRLVHGLYRPYLLHNDENRSIFINGTEIKKVSSILLTFFISVPFCGNYYWWKFKLGCTQRSPCQKAPFNHWCNQQD